ncbi:MAG: 2-C-methyl-D-erythritol 4-phosphate cytidylyltransferase [Bacteroidia bacterium]|nr:2-C-methyl-D-erythritol 4-phosphate cytidylyltransferase [Bacteroidia bacterium]
MKNYAIIVAGGSGTRMNSQTPKQFMLLGGLPVLMHCIRAFYRFDPDITIIASLPVAEKKNWDTLCKKHQFTIHHIIADGGEKRFYSVKNAFAFMGDEGLVAIHDGVRPLVSIATIRNCFEQAAITGNAIPVIAAVDSVRIQNEDGHRPFDRTALRLVQTPQVFDCRLIKEAYHREYKNEFTDDASVFESAGHTIHLVEGNTENIKITSPQDLIIAEALLNSRCQ